MPDRIPVAEIYGEDVARFLSYFEEGTEEECWPWVGGLSKQGYGAFWLGQRTVGAHVISYQLFRGLRVEGIVTHSCDKKDCVNWHHLSDGSYSSNTLEALERNRYSTPPGRKKSIPEAKIRTCLNLRALGWTYSAIAETLELSTMSAYFIVNGRNP